ncbi:MAG: hypothetical protein JWS10_3115 [Cypionkella sp.]|uniref:hypothetical protein n=1 Tax=Cypionkella sp. TaxID=2811411 RepID=UPI00263027B1|nr:hypothetical protein [Cypionkella sp.]MDB5660500.1 hypothetical protein [Cypionkella sp.]
MEPKTQEEILVAIEISQQNVISLADELELQRVKMRARQRLWWPLVFLSFFGSGLMFAAILAVALAFWR